MTALELLNESFMVTVNLLGVLFNGVLIFAIVFKSPKQIKTYSFLLLNLAITDLASCLLAVYLVQRIIPFDDSILYISNGFCGLLGLEACFYGYGVILVLYSHTNWNLLASFVFRLYILHREAPSRRVLWLALLTISAPSIFQFSILITFIIDAKGRSALEIFSRIHPEIDTTGKIIYGALHVRSPDLDWKPFVATWMVILPFMPILLAVFLIRRKILATLERHKSLSRRSRRLHGQLLRALTLQACLPAFYLVALIMFLVQQYDLVHNVFLEYGFMNLISVIPSCSPLLPLYFVHSYREFLAGLVKRRPSEGNEVYLLDNMDKFS